MEAQGSGDSMYTDYDIQKALSDATGGHAFYSTNDVTAALNDATDIGGNYYSLTYSPTNQKDDGGRRSIQYDLPSGDITFPIAASISQLPSIPRMKP